MKAGPSPACARGVGGEQIRQWKQFTEWARSKIRAPRADEPVIVTDYQEGASKTAGTYPDREQNDSEVERRD